ncbi:hypothetical protein HXX76_014178 [Chlamydomonas incerta]|uniref:Uncharacterized protein n=1 Tax=Chlamydomonas incerta TaxID=51695 RepID=A0A835VRF0_CHLIN|nr:hypothetical protein HXX76_014178 [Chlamydomonas incerta]|eukprot:KAG2425020.1 hypothetical protein HXX76_014178 [Chlamydomonas incerta]
MAAVSCVAVAALLLVLFLFKSGLIGLDGGLVASGIVIGMVWVFVVFSGRVGSAAGTPVDAADSNADGPAACKKTVHVPWGAIIVVEVTAVLVGVLWISHAMGWPSTLASVWGSAALLILGYLTAQKVDSGALSCLWSLLGPMSLQVGSAATFLVILCVLGVQWAVRPSPRVLASLVVVGGALLTGSAAVVWASLNNQADSTAFAADTAPFVTLLAAFLVLLGLCVALTRRFLRSSFLDPLGFVLGEVIRLVAHLNNFNSTVMLRKHVMRNFVQKTPAVPQLRLAVQRLGVVTGQNVRQFTVTTFNALSQAPLLEPIRESGAAHVAQQEQQDPPAGSAASAGPSAAAGSPAASPAPNTSTSLPASSSGAGGNEQPLAVAIYIFRLKGKASNEELRTWYHCCAGAISGAWQQVLGLRDVGDSRYLISSAAAVLHAQPQGEEDPVVVSAKEYMQQQISSLSESQMVEAILESNRLLYDLLDALDQDGQSELTQTIRTGDSGNILYLCKVVDRPDAAGASPVQDQPVNRSAAARYMPTRLVTARINPVATCLADLLLPPRRVVAGPPDSCGPEAIVETYRAPFAAYNQRHTRSARFPADLTYRTFAGPEWDGVSPITTTPREMAAFLDRYGLGLRVLDVHGGDLYRHHPCKPCAVLSPAALTVVYHGSHLAVARPGATPRASAVAPRPSGALCLGFGPPAAQRRTRLVNTVQEITDQVRACARSSTTSPLLLSLAWNGGDLLRLLSELVAAGITPHISVRRGIDVGSLSLRDLRLPDCQQRLTVSITRPCNVEGESGARFQDQAELDEFCRLEHALDCALFDRRHASCMRQDTVDLLTAAQPAIVSGHVPRRGRPISCDTLLACVDWSKFYACCLADLPYLPVLSPFAPDAEAPPLAELPRPQKEEEGGGALLLVVDVLDTDSHMYPPERTLMFEWEAAQLPQGVRVRVLRALPVFPMEVASVREAVRSVFACAGLSANFKKAIVNRAIGRCGKKLVRSRHAVVCGSRGDAVRLAEAYGGQRMASPHGGDTWVVAWNSGERPLNETYLPIHAAILAMARVKMDRLARQALGAGMTLLAYRTDSIFVALPRRARADERRASAFLSDWAAGHGYELGSLPGQLKFEVGRPPKVVLPGHALRAPAQVQVHPQVQPRAGARATPAVQQFATSSDALGFLQRGGMQSGTVAMCRAGRGKTHVVVTCAVQQHGRGRVLVVCAWNAQCQLVEAQYGVPTCTACALFGLDVTGAFSHKRVDVSKYDALVFDELLLMSHRQLFILERYMAAHPDKAFYATADPCQLDAIDAHIPASVRVAAVRALFPRSLQIQRSARSADGEQLARLESSLLEQGAPVEEVALAHFRTVTLSEALAMGVTRALSYYHATCDRLNAAFRAHCAGGASAPDSGLLLGETLVCRENLWAVEDSTQRRAKLCVNTRVRVVRVSGPSGRKITLEHRVASAGSAGARLNHYTLPERRVVAAFQSGYCTTVHSAQGSTLDGPVLVADWSGNRFAGPKWFYTAVTRCRSLGDVLLLAPGSLPHQVRNRCLRGMVAGYKRQDEAAGRGEGWAPEEYVDAAWIEGQLAACGGVCKGCGRFMSLEKGHDCQATVNRLNNALAHLKHNCELVCLLCNQQSSCA